MKITRANYEQMAMEFVEGTLRPDRKADFEAFLAENSDIAAEIAALCEHTPFLPPCVDIYPDKEALYKGRGQTALPRRKPSRRIISAAAAVAAGIAIVVTLSINKNPAGGIASETPAETPAETPTETPTETPKDTAGSNVQNIVADSETDTEEISPEDNAVAAQKAHPAATRTPDQAQDVFIAEDSELQPILPEDILIETLEPDMTIIAMAGIGQHEDLTDFGTITPKAEFFDDPFVETQQDDMQPEDYESPDNRRRGGRGNKGGLRRAIASFVAPFDELNPIRTHKTENTSSIQIASFVIEKTTEQN